MQDAQRKRKTEKKENSELKAFKQDCIKLTEDGVKMKEVTYEEWQKNPTPRMMWCWNSNAEDKVQAKVIYVVKTDACIYPVLSIMKDDVGYETFRHCAEIEKQRRMTKKELSR